MSLMAVAGYEFEILAVAKGGVVIFRCRISTSSYTSR